MSGNDLETILNVCPAPLPARVGERDTFFDSVLVARAKLQEPMMASEFLAEMLQWAGRTPDKSNRYLQNVIDAYYIVGLVPRVCLPEDEDHKIRSELPAGADLPSLRRYCLKVMTHRLYKMPLFWGALTHHEPFTTSVLHGLLKEKGYSFDDIKRRLRLMRNLGALQKSGDSYRLTQLGNSFATDQSEIIYLKTLSHEVIAEDSDDPTDYPNSFGAVAFLDY